MYKNNKLHFVLLSIWTSMVLYGSALFAQQSGSVNPPNIVLIFVDDLGYGDLGSYGASGFETPNLDKLASQGTRFTNFYAAQAVCSASRAGLMTGCYPNRIGISGALMPWSKVGLNSEETTIAELLKPMGYATSIVGKWHLGHQEEFLPLQHGFDEYYGLPYSNDMWPVNYDGNPITDSNDFKIKYPVLHLIEGNNNAQPIHNLDDMADLTTLYTEEAVKFIQSKSENPFFLYLAHSMPHVPLAVSEKFKGKSKQGLFGDVIMELDWSVGEVMKVLDENGLSENTIVIFTSDNGPWLSMGNHAGSTGGLREGKGTSYEGGQREPCIVRWPGHTPPGTVCSKLSATIDIFPTLAAITGAALPAKQIDGVDISALWNGNFKAEPRNVFYYYYGRNNLEAIRMGKWKMVFPHILESYEGTPPGKDGFPGKKIMRTAELALYDLDRDPGERYNVIDLYPEVVDSIQKIADKARQDLGDDLTNSVGKNRREPGREKVDYSLFSQNIKHKAFGKPACLLTDEGMPGAEITPAVLTDGFVLTQIDHNNDLRFWKGFEGTDMDIIIDLQKVEKINSVSINFLHEISQWIFRPQSVNCLISEDGKNYQDAGELSFKVPLDQRQAKMDTYYFTIDKRTRFIRLKAENIKTCPDWHVGKGQKAWIFADEIVVR
jgi:arylsulfatase A-like enzyme